MIATVILHVGYSVRASYHEDWLDAFLAHPDLACEAVNIFSAAGRRRAARRIRDAELVVILHSATGETLAYLDTLGPALQARRGKLAVFMGNEFNMPWLPFAQRRRWLRSVGTDIVATQLVAATGRWLYDGSGAHVVSLPHALNPAAFAWHRPRQDRGLDIAGRSFPYPLYIGDETRNRLYLTVGPAAARHGLKTDVRFMDRLDRAGWAALLNDSRFTVASEAGSAHLERDDARTHAMRAWLQERRKGGIIKGDSPLRAIGRRLPWRMRETAIRLLGRLNIAHEAIETEPELARRVHDAFFAGLPDASHSGRCISSRHWDAIGCGTVQLLVAGRYNDLLQPWLHYIPLKPDLSDLETVLPLLSDPDFGQEIADRAHHHALDRHTHRHRLDELLRTIGRNDPRPET